MDHRWHSQGNVQQSQCSEGLQQAGLHVRTCVDHRGCASRALRAGHGRVHDPQHALVAHAPGPALAPRPHHPQRAGALAPCRSTAALTGCCRPCIATWNPCIVPGTLSGSASILLGRPAYSTCSSYMCCLMRLDQHALSCQSFVILTQFSPSGVTLQELCMSCCQLHVFVPV